MRNVYLDYSATTPVKDEVLQEMIPYFTQNFGNPSSLYTPGLTAKEGLAEARRRVAGLIGAEPGEIYFTSCGTEADNWVLEAIADKMKDKGRHIITSKIEHHAILHTCKYLEKFGFDVTYLDVDEEGFVQPEALKDAMRDDTVLVSIMAVNNETGFINPIEKVRKIIDKTNSPALFHVDAVQAFGKIPLKPKKLGIDILTASSHKIHGPKGAGILYLRKGARIIPLHYGGEQEKKIRPGTEPLPNICGMGEAVKNLPDMNKELQFMRELNAYCREKLKDISNVHINSNENCLPYIINFSVEGIKSETMLHYLEEKNIYISSGSACAKGKKSHVLTAMGLSDNLINSALRVSFSRYNSKSDIDELVKAVINANNTLAKIK